MNEFLFAFQMASAIGYGSFVALLLLCPYSGPQFRNYFRVRRLFALGLAILAVQFVVQMVFGFRAHGATYGAACNLFFICPASQFCTLAVFSLLRANSSCRREWIALTSFSILNAIALAAGCLVNNGAYLRAAVLFSFILYFLVNMSYSIVLVLEYRRKRELWRHFYSVPVELDVTWIYIYLLIRIACCLFMPVLLYSHVLTIVYSIAIWLSFMYFVARFMYYGFYIKTMEKWTTTRTTRPLTTNWRATPRQRPVG